jgi:hypothetical protein
VANAKGTVAGFHVSLVASAAMPATRVAVAFSFATDRSTTATALGCRAARSSEEEPSKVI